MSAVKYHVNPETGRANQCSATVKDCRFAVNGEMPPHFETKSDAKKHAEHLMENKHGMFSGTKKNVKSSTVQTSTPDTVIRNNRVMNSDTAFLKDSLAELANNLVEVRAEQGNATFNGANPEKAKQRLQEAINFATKRDNTHLVKKLSQAKVLPSGSFVTDSGKKFNTDTMIKNSTAEKFVKDGRSYYERELTKIASDSTIPNGAKFNYKNDNGSYSMTVNDGKFHEDEFNNLPENIKSQIVSPKESIDINLIREKISPEKQAQILKNTQVIDYVIGKSPNIGQQNVAMSRNFEGNTPAEKLNSGLRNVGEFYTSARQQFEKSQSELRSEKTEMTNAIKDVAAANGGTVFAPARSASNGAIVTGRQIVDQKEVSKILTPEEIQSVTSVKPTPDAEKAKTVLSPELYNKIFNARAVSLRITEKAS